MNYDVYRKESKEHVQAITRRHYFLVSVTQTFYYRYLELVHPLWHKSHFKIKWIYISLAANVSLSTIFHAAYKLPTTKV